MAVTIHSGLCVRNRSMFVAMAEVAVAQQQEVWCELCRGFGSILLLSPTSPRVLHLDPGPQGSHLQNAPSSSTNSQDSFRSLKLTQTSILTFVVQFPHLKKIWIITIAMGLFYGFYKTRRVKPRAKFINASLLVTLLKRKRLALGTD